MKIIDLLNKIANGEQPKKIKYCDIIYNFEEYKGDYGYVNKDCGKYKWFACLNDEVEIIKEEKKLPEKLVDILKVDDLEPPYDSNLQKIWVQTIKNHNKINEICDYLKSKGDE